MALVSENTPLELLFDSYSFYSYSFYSQADDIPVTKLISYLLGFFGNSVFGRCISYTLISSTSILQLNFQHWFLNNLCGNYTGCGTRYLPF